MLKFIRCGYIMVLFCSCNGLINRVQPIYEYTAILRYDYNQENSTIANMMDYHIRSLDEYIFDEHGTLLMINDLGCDVCLGTWSSAIILKPGRYSVITVGNLEERSLIWDESTGGAPVIGYTNRRDMRLKLNETVTCAGEACGPSEALYYGYRTFTVEQDVISNVRVDMIHAHLKIKFRATWKGGTAPSTKSNYYTVLETIPSQYALMPEYYYPKGSFLCVEHDEATSDNYELSSNYVLHYIPQTNYLGYSPVTYRYDTYINNDNELWGEFTAYRLKNETSVKLKILHWNEETKTMTNMLKYDIDLQKYLTTHLGINLNHALKQEYDFSIEIVDGIAILKGLNIADWEEGDIISKNKHFFYANK